MLKRDNNPFPNHQISKKQLLHLACTMMIFILFILWSNYLIHSNVALQKHQYQSSLSQDSAEGDLSDLYGRDDDYSDSLGNIYYFDTLVSHYIFWAEVNLSFIYKILLIANSKERKRRTGIDNWELLEILSALILMASADNYNPSQEDLNIFEKYMLGAWRRMLKCFNKILLHWQQKYLSWQSWTKYLRKGNFIRNGDFEFNVIESEVI